MKIFKKYYEIAAEPEMVYQALVVPITIQLWSGAEAEMSEDVNAEFSLWGGDISGKNMEFVKGKKIVQQWYFDGEEEESVVTIKLHAGKRSGTTSVELIHTNIPDAVYDEFVEGWNESYFGALQEFFEAE